MFRRMNKLMHAHRERILSLVLLPAFILGTLPHTACICADGHRESSCKVAACRSLASGPRASSCCGCDCCKPRESQDGRLCCQAKQHCQSVAPGQQPLSGLIASGSTCCHPITEAPAPATSFAKADVGSKQKQAAVAEITPALTLAGKTCLAFDLVDFSGPPPLDLVIVLQRLTI